MQDDELIAREKNLISTIISMYHTTRLRETPFADHIHSKAIVRDAFDALYATRPALSEDDAELVKRLREGPYLFGCASGEMFILTEAAARIEALSRENAELKAADRDHLSATRGMETRLTGQIADARRQALEDAAAYLDAKAEYNENERRAWRGGSNMEMTHRTRADMYRKDATAIRNLIGEKS